MDHPNLCAYSVYLQYSSNVIQESIFLVMSARPELRFSLNTLGATVEAKGYTSSTVMKLLFELPLPIRSSSERPPARPLWPPRFAAPTILRMRANPRLLFETLFFGFGWLNGLFSEVSGPKGRTTSFFKRLTGLSPGYRSTGKKCRNENLSWTAITYRYLTYWLALAFMVTDPAASMLQRIKGHAKNSQVFVLILILLSLSYYCSFKNRPSISY